MVYKIKVYKNNPSPKTMAKVAEQMRQYIRENVTQDDACKFIEHCIDAESIRIKEINDRKSAMQKLLTYLRERPQTDNIFK